MVNIGYYTSPNDSYVYFRYLQDGSFIYLIVAKESSEIGKLKEQLTTEFEMKDIGAAQKILGMQIRQDHKIRELYMSQKDYDEMVLDCFSMKNAKHLITLATRFILSALLSPQSDKEV